MLRLHLRPVCCVVCVAPARGWFFSSALREPRSHAWCLCHVPGLGTTWEQVPVLVRVSSPEPAPGAQRWGGLGVSRRSLDGPGGAVLYCADGVGSPPLQYGEHFEFDCKDCICLEGGSGIICKPKTCRPEPRLECEEDGTYAFTEVDPTNTCCNLTSCSKAPASGVRGPGGPGLRRVCGAWALGRQVVRGPRPRTRSAQGGVQAQRARVRTHWRVPTACRVQRQPVQGEAPAVLTGLPGEERDDA